MVWRRLPNPMHKPIRAAVNGRITLRLSILVLMLANVAFFAWMQYGTTIRALSTDSHLVNQQINPDAVRVLTAEQVAALVKQQESGADATNGVVSAACLEWGAFNTADAAKAEQALAALALGSRLGRRRIEETAAWWVFLPPQPSRQIAQQKVAELKRLGVAEYFIIQEDSRLRFAVSLGVFRSEEAAKTHLAQLRAKGVRTAQVGPRDAQVQHVYFQVRDVADALRARLIELELSFPGTNLKDCGVAPAGASAPAGAALAGVGSAAVFKAAPGAVPGASPKAGK